MRQTRPSTIAEHAEAMGALRKEIIKMKAVVGLFNMSGTRAAQDALLASGFQPNQIREMNRVEDLPAYVEGEPEKTASWGWLAGTVVGALVGAALGWLVMSMYSAQYLALTLLISAAAGGAIGGYLLSIYAVRADETLDMDVREALGEEKSLLVVETDGKGASRAAGIMKRHGSEHVAVYLIPKREPERV